MLCSLATPPFALVQRIYQQARASVRWTGGERGAGSPRMQRWLQRVSAEFRRRLEVAGIYVEEE
jgi:hypothetical protein